MSKRNKSDVISASEMGSFTYCARAWWLRRVRGYESQNYDALAAGLRTHEQHGRAVIGQETMRRAGLILLVLAVGSGIILLIKCGAG